jgi:hypothetical protein
MTESGISPVVFNIIARGLVMKKKFLGMMILFALTGHEAYAGCTMKCMTRDPFSGRCIAKMKVCSPSVEGIVDTFKDGWEQLESAWKDVYGVLPENMRVVLNKYPVTVIGFAAGGYEGAALGNLIDRSVNKIIGMGEKTKVYINMSDEWKEPIYMEGYAIATGRQIQITGSMKRGREHILPELETAYDKFLECMLEASDVSYAKQVCLWPFQVEAFEIQMKLEG